MRKLPFRATGLPNTPAVYAFVVSLRDSLESFLIREYRPIHNAVIPGYDRRFSNRNELLAIGYCLVAGCEVQA